MKIRLVLLTIVLALGLAPAARADTNDVKPVIARTQGDALVLWDATELVTQIVNDRATDSDADARLANGALKALAQTAPHLSDAKTITVRVVYARTGAVSPVYGTPTFAGVERFATLEIAGPDARSDAGHWKEAAAAAPGELPKSVTFTVTGKLPPR